VLRSFLFTDNETNAERLFGARDPPPWVKDAFHRHVVNHEDGILNCSESGSWRRVNVGGACFTHDVVPAGGGEDAAPPPV
jgi:hypothetical protein